jgi:23S rRNA pseudouridine1911/1915/1917 synthase
MNLLDRLALEFPEASRRTLKQWLMSSRVELDGRLVTKATLEVPKSAKLTLRPRAAATSPKTRWLLQVIHEDAALLVVNKPPGMLSVPTPLIKQESLLDRATQYLEGKNQKPLKVHRLDRKTSGLLIFAKTEAALEAMKAQFEQRTIIRKYIARVHGKVKPPQATLTHWLQEGIDLKVRIVQKPKETGKPEKPRRPLLGKHPEPTAPREAITHFRVLEREEESTLLGISIKTGRRAQIRVQLANMGHPIIGDNQYGKPGPSTDRMFLHASGLEFIHPATGETLKLEAPPPAEFNFKNRS